MKWKFWLTGLMAGASSMASAVPLDTIGTFCGLFPGQCRQGTESLMAVRGTGTNAYYVLEADPTTGALPVNVTGGTLSITIASDGVPGAAVPVDANYTGLNNGGNLIGAVGDSSGRAIVAGAGTAGTPAGGLLSVQGVSTGTALPVTISGQSATSTIVASNDYSSSNVGTGAYVQLIASTANAVNTVCLSNANGASLKIATGAAASEVDRIYLPGGGAGCYNIKIPASTRVSLKSIDTTASTGFFLFTGY